MSHQSDPPILPLAEGSARHQPRKRVTFCEPEELPPFQRKRAEDETRRCVPTAATSAQTALVVSVVKEVQDMMNDVENDWDAPTTPRHDMQNRQALINTIVETLKEREHVGSVGFGNASGLGKTAVQVAVMEHFRDDCSPIYMSFGDSFRCDAVDDHLSIEFLGAWLEAGKLSTRWCSNTHGEDANTQQTNGGVIEVSPMVWEKAVAAFVAAARRRGGGANLPCNVDSSHIVAIDGAHNLGNELLHKVVNKLHATTCKGVVVTGTFLPEPLLSPNGRRFVCLPFEPLDDDAFCKVWKEGRGLPDVVEGRQGVHTLVGGSLRVLHALADTMDENDVELTMALVAATFRQIYGTPHCSTQLELALANVPVSTRVLNAFHEQGKIHLGQVFLTQLKHGDNDTWIIQVPPVQVHCGLFGLCDVRCGCDKCKNKIYLRSGLQDKLRCLQKRMLEGKKGLCMYPPGDSSFLIGLRLHSIGQHEHHSYPLRTVLGSFRMNNAAKALVDTCDPVHSGTVWMETLQHTMDGKEGLVPDYSKLIQAHVDCSTFIISLENICSAPFDTHMCLCVFEIEDGYYCFSWER